MGGDIFVNSFVGKGKSFKFAIPFKSIKDREFSVLPQRQVVGLAPNESKYRIFSS